MDVCGIIGYVGPRPAQEVLLNGLERLEYRGYDSVGVALLDGPHIQVAKQMGRIAGLREKLATAPLSGHSGIGHTRWATHGQPSDQNAHPHTDCSGHIAVVHNGIIENEAALRRELIAAGHHFRSETDTEVIAHLIEEADGDSLSEAVRTIRQRLRGSYAIAVLDTRHPDEIVVARNEAPLVIGLGEGERFVASDIPAFLPYTRWVLPLEDGDTASLKRDEHVLWNAQGERITRQPYIISWSAEAAERSGYATFMEKEIHEQPRAWRETMRGRLALVSPQQWALHLDEEAPRPQEWQQLHQLFLIGCGTAYHAAMVGGRFFEQLARVAPTVDLASEFRYRDPIIGSGDIAIFVSQSGETADTLAAMRLAKVRGATTVAVTNVVGSTLAREADRVFYTQAGPEIAVASTKAYTTQVIALALLALDLGNQKGQLKADRAVALVQSLLDLPRLGESVLDQSAQWEPLAAAIAHASSAFYLGRGLDWAAALEGALKMKEISYVHAEAYAAGELKHGTLALVEAATPVVALITQPHLVEKSLSNLREVKARGASVLAITTERLSGAVGEVADAALVLPDTDPLATPVLAALPLQVLALMAATLRGNDVDKPRNLAKSVTVE